VSVRLFAMLREEAGCDRVEVELDDGATVADLLVALGAEPGLGPAPGLGVGLELGPGLGETLSRLPVVTAVNREYVRGEHRLREGDEVALIPPVSGGGGTEGCGVEGVAGR